MAREPEFDESADMRLVELRRAALGVAAVPRGPWESQLEIDGSPETVEKIAEALSAVLAVDVHATPSEGVIPGAIVTLSLSLANEGAKPARDVRAIVPLPGGAAYRNGSFMRDGRPLLDDAADESVRRWSADRKHRTGRARYLSMEDRRAVGE